VVVCETAEAAVRGADVVTSATSAKSPIIMGEWIKQGAHVDLVGAHGPDMREADDELISTPSLFVDSRETVLEHIGELRIPIAQGVVKACDVLGDLYEFVGGNNVERYREETTVFKNGGGAHLDLMMANYFFKQARK
jgi:ornithine cyclodeaminase